MTTYVINGEPDSLPVDIEFPNEGNRADTIFLQAKSRAKLPAFSRIPKGFLQQHPKVRTHLIDGIDEPAATETVI